MTRPVFTSGALAGPSNDAAGTPLLNPLPFAASFPREPDDDRSLPRAMVERKNLAEPSPGARPQEYFSDLI